jgi:peptidyl-dipeptidase A
VLHSHFITRPARFATEVFAMFMIASILPVSAADPAKELEAQAKAFIADAEKTLIPLDVAQGKAWWVANTKGTKEAYERLEAAQNKQDLALADREAFGKLKRIHDAIEKRAAAKDGAKVDPLIARQIKLMYLRRLGKQVDPSLLQEITKLGNKVEKAFNAYRAVIDGKEYNDNDLTKVLKESTDPAVLRKAWEGSKGIAPLIRDDLLQLVRTRNRIAVLSGFDNYQQMSLALEEHDAEALLKLFDEIDELTRDAFRDAKAELDGRLAKRLKIEVKDLRPWHYQNPFFQEPPAVYDVDLDALYTGQDIVKLSRDFYRSIGLPVDAVLDHSDLFPREKTSQDKKSPHAFCTDIDREGDVRVLANIAPDERWMSTMLHELGHSVYSSQYYPQKLPFYLRDAAHTLTTEGLAMLFERQTKVLGWMDKANVAPRGEKSRAATAEVARQMLRNKLLIFSRWAQVMFRFEKGMYENPDQDLNKLWWDLVEKYQMLHRPEGRDAPDYAAKIHIVVAPVYYHNYALGELFASQVHAAMCKKALGGVSPHDVSYYGDKRVGDFVRKEIIERGTTLSWNDLMLKATGERLNPKAFAKDMAAR